MTTGGHTFIYHVIQDRERDGEKKKKKNIILLNKRKKKKKKLE